MGLIGLILTGALAVTQVPDATLQSIVDELKAIRATLEKVDATQRMLTALLRIQIDEGRLASLEGEWRTLAAQERALNDELGALRANAERLPQATALAFADAASDVNPDSDQPEARAHREEVGRKAEEVKRSLRTLEASIADARSRIAAWEKFLQQLLQ
jgi:hypothetical protein